MKTKILLLLLCLYSAAFCHTILLVNGDTEPHAFTTNYGGAYSSYVVPASSTLSIEFYATGGDWLAFAVDETLGSHGYVGTYVPSVDSVMCMEYNTPSSTYPYWTRINAKAAAGAVVDNELFEAGFNWGIVMGMGFLLFWVIRRMVSGPINHAAP